MRGGVGADLGVGEMEGLFVALRSARKDGYASPAAEKYGVLSYWVFNKIVSQYTHQAGYADSCFGSRRKFRYAFQRDFTHYMLCHSPQV